MQAPELVDYHDYRAFLKDDYTFRKRQVKNYSYRQYAKELGFAASNFLHLVVTDRRNLSLDAITRIKSGFHWTAQQKKYFHNLVLFNQSGERDKKAEYAEELEKIVGKKRLLLNPDQFSYFSTWYIPVLREIVSLKGFVSNLNWIAKKLKPRVDEDLVRKGLEILERLGLIRRVKNQWRQHEEHLTTPVEVSSTLVHNYHKEMIKLSQLALDLAPGIRDISAMTMSLSKVQFEWLKQRVIDFRDEIQQELQGMQDEPTLVAQLNIQVFPVTEE